MVLPFSLFRTDLLCYVGIYNHCVVLVERVDLSTNVCERATCILSSNELPVEFLRYTYSTTVQYTCIVIIHAHQGRWKQNVIGIAKICMQSAKKFWLH